MGPDEQVFELDAEVDCYFDDSSLSDGGQPRIVMLLGAPAVGKTTIRKQRYSTGYVLVDAVPVFLSLSRGAYLDFPGPFEQVLDVIGPHIARRAIRERRHIVTELIGADLAPTEALIEAMEAVGYRIEAQMVTCDVEEALRRNRSRGDDDISTYYAEPFQRAWLRDAAIAEAAARPGGPASSSRKSTTKPPRRTPSRKKAAANRK